MLCQASKGLCSEDWQTPSVLVQRKLKQAKEVSVSAGSNLTRRLHFATTVAKVYLSLGDTLRIPLPPGPAGEGEMCWTGIQAVIVTCVSECCSRGHSEPGLPGQAGRLPLVDFQLEICLSFPPLHVGCGPGPLCLLWTGFKAGL